MDRVEYLVKKGTTELRDRKHENGLHMDPDRSAGDVRTVPPNEWFMDSFGRLSKTGDRYVRSIRKAEDDKIAEGCTFKPTLSKATQELVKNTPYLQHTNFYDRGLEWAERKKRAIAAGQGEGGRGGARVHVPAANRGRRPRVRSTNRGEEASGEDGARGCRRRQ